MVLISNNNSIVLSVDKKSNSFGDQILIFRKFFKNGKTVELKIVNHEGNWLDAWEKNNKQELIEIYNSLTKELDNEKA